MRGFEPNCPKEPELSADSYGETLLRRLKDAKLLSPGQAELLFNPRLVFQNVEFLQKENLSMPSEETAERASTHREEQHTTYSTLKEGPNNDTLTFTLDFYVVRLVCICVIPESGFRQAPVYVKFRLRGAKEAGNG